MRQPFSLRDYKISTAAIRLPPTAPATASIAFTLAVWAWMLTRPAGTFHDQGGLMITLYYFPATFVVWLACSIVAWKAGGGVLAYALLFAGLVLSIGTLAIA